MKKSELLQWLQVEYQQWQAFLSEIDPARLEEPGVAAHWSIKDMIAHLNGWQPRLIARIQAAQQGKPEPTTPWPAHLQSDDEINAWIYETNQGRAVRDVLDEAHQLYQQLIVVIEGLPEDVRIDDAYRVVWLGEKRFAAGEYFDHFHDDHEPDVRSWLARTQNP